MFHKNEIILMDTKILLVLRFRYDTDMMFAQQCGFQKLLVGSGADSIDNPPKDLNVQVDYYLPALADLASLIS